MRKTSCLSGAEFFNASTIFPETSSLFSNPYPSLNQSKCMIIHLCLLINGLQASCMLLGPIPQWAVEPPNYINQLPIANGLLTLGSISLEIFIIGL